jgi:protease-4
MATFNVVNGLKMDSKPGIIHRIFTGTWAFINGFRRVVLNLLFLLIIAFIVMSMLGTEKPVVNSNTMLVVKPLGFIVDEKDYVKPLDEAIDEMRETSSRPPQTLLADILKAIDMGRNDPNIDSMLLDLGSMFGAEPSKLQEIARYINNFKTSGKTVYAYAEALGQSQYYLAAHADQVIMDPMGNVFIDGFGRFNTYFRGAIEKLGIKTHVFKVGTYKSAVEPYIRDNMSPEAKEANLEYLNDLWTAYKNDVQAARSLPPESIQNYSDNFLDIVSNSEIEMAEIALENNLVDQLKDRESFKQYLMEEEGSNIKGDNYRGLNFQTYLDIKKPIMLDKSIPPDSVAVVVAKGVILNGKQKAGTIGGQSTAELIRKARKNKNVKALVLRVDSPGGSAYASEVIRREILATKAVKPVVVSMGSYAASGGYWISANADEIWASPTTITGSIGIFGMLATFETPLNNVGIYRDGVGTTNLTGAFDAGRALREDVGAAIQQSINNGYKQFLSIVAEGRNMTVEAVDKVAQGRVWSGEDALELGLVDKLGNLDQAIASAATLAGMINYEITYITQELSPGEQFLKDVFNSEVWQVVTGDSGSTIPKLSATDILLNQLQSGVEQLQMLDDPNNMYAHCLCNIN